MSFVVRAACAADRCSAVADGRPDDDHVPDDCSVIVAVVHDERESARARYSQFGLRHHSTSAGADFFAHRLVSPLPPCQLANTELRWTGDSGGRRFSYRRFAWQPHRAAPYACSLLVVRSLEAKKSACSQCRCSLGGASGANSRC